MRGFHRTELERRVLDDLTQKDKEAEERELRAKRLDAESLAADLAEVETVFGMFSGMDGKHFDFNRESVREWTTKWGGIPFSVKRHGHAHRWAVFAWAPSQRHSAGGHWVHVSRLADLKPWLG